MSLIQNRTSVSHGVFTLLSNGRIFGTTKIINADTTLYLSRPPEGEWLCLQAEHIADRQGIGVAEVVQHDHRGRYGRSLQARLANRWD